MKFGENLKNLRTRKKISQEELAEKVGVSRQSVSKWECSESYPEMDNILKLCKIFHCKINDLVQEDLMDINQLDKEVKQSVVKFQKEKQQKMKKISKAITILSRIGKIIVSCGVIVVILTMILTIVLASNTKIEKNKIIIYNEEIDYKLESNEFVLKYQDKSIQLKDKDNETLKTFLDITKNHSILSLTILIEIAFLFLIVYLIILYCILKYLEKLFDNIYQGETPFTLENVSYIKKMAYYMIAMILIPTLGGFLTEWISTIDLEIEFEIYDFIYVLFLMGMSYIFEYGYEIQRDSKGKIYDEE